ncbi:hypothetical protein APHAL10511_008589 [Amanita phalloides]|nr:hypothetical protein APHAL10511_008589 [Amanita phalloides]
MSGQSPPRSRRQAHPTAVGQIHNVQTRETSRSPSLRERPRQVKQSSMPLSSSAAAQMYSNSNATQQSLQTLQSQQSSPPMSNPARRSPPPGQSHRMLPTPPHPNPQIDASERRSASPGSLHSHVPPGVTTHYPRPMHNNTARVLEKYHEDWEVTDQLMEEIERADMQQVPSHAIPPPLPHMNSYPPPSSYGREETVSPPKDPLEKVRVTERASPKELDLASQRRQREREQQTARESPKTRDRQQVSASPNSGTFTIQNHSHTPENRGSPYHTPHGSQGDYPQYIPHDPPTLTRRNTISAAHQPDVRTQQAQQQPSVVSQSPPSAAMLARAPDRSLPVQEEAEDDVGLGSKNGGPSRDSWKNNEPHLDQQRVDSPQHADLTADEGGGPRYDPAHPTLNGRDNGPGHRAMDEKAARMASKDDMDDHRFVDHGAEEYTPRSPTANLPESMMESFPTPQAAVKMGSRPRPRSGATDQLGLRGLEALIEQNGPPGAVRDPNPAPPPANDQNRQQQFSSHRKPVPEIGEQNQQQQIQQQQSQSQQHAAPSPQNYRYDPRDPRYNSRYYIPDDLHNYPDDASVYFQSYIQSPRPDAPIPPTPHSQTAAPSPSPLISGAYDNRNGRDLPPFSPIAPVGSPYPFPFNHVRRPATFQHSANNNNLANGNGPGPTNIDQAMLREQYAKQWQIFAQNNNWGAMSDSTFSPAPTPFQGAFSPWAHWHTQRMFGKVPGDAMSMQSSPSHEPVPLPKAHPVSLRKAQTNMRGGSKLKREASSSSPPRKPPPRVESTQPRDTSPEPSSSGEETAGEESYETPSASHSMPFEERWPTVVMPIGEEDDDESDWVDEDEEVDQEDLLELEYHPTYVRTSEKRRRRWEIGWEALTQAFQNLDRQTDTTMVLVASPADSSKIHIINSRSIRRTSVLSHSPAMRRLKAAFRGIAHHRRQTRTRKMPIIDHILTQTNSIGEGSDGSSESREGDLRRVLGTALSSLDALKNMYEQREARWNEEMARMYKERENVEFFLRQLYGDRQGMNGTNGVLSLQVP